MKIEVLGDKKYIDTITSNDGVWVLMSGSSMYMLKAESGNALPTWMSKEEADEFKVKARLTDVSPIFAPLSTFIGVWLKSNQLQISEIVASPNYGADALSYTKEELVEKFTT